MLTIQGSSRSTASCPGILPDQLIRLPWLWVGQQPLRGWVKMEGGNLGQRPYQTSPEEHEPGEKYGLTLQHK